MKLSYLLLFALAASLVLLAGCSGAPPSQAPQANPPASTVPEGTATPQQPEASTTPMPVPSENGNAPEMVVEPSTPSTEPIAVSLTSAEVAKHATADDCWMIIDGNVYNLSGFPANHSGGPQIAGMCGKDATQLFQTRAGKGPHPDKAQAKLETMLLGPLAAG